MINKGTKSDSLAVSGDATKAKEVPAPQVDKTNWDLLNHTGKGRTSDKD